MFLVEIATENDNFTARRMLAVFNISRDMQICESIMVAHKEEIGWLDATRGCLRQE
jgi:hypothetical protein